MEDDFDLTYISLGAGRQSTAMAICSALGLYNVPKASIALFADTGDEPPNVYEHLSTFRDSRMDRRWSSPSPPMH